MLVHAGPGAGKTLGALLSFQAMRHEGLLENLLVFCHRNSIASQWYEAAKILGLKMENLEVDQDLKAINNDLNGWIVTYQSASKQPFLLTQLIEALSIEGLMAIADEAHHLGVNPNEPESPIWGKSFLEITKGSKLRLGLTGTPFRADNLAFCSARKVAIESQGEFIEQITPDLSVEPSELISAGDVRPLEFHFQDGWVEHSFHGQPNSERSLLSQERRESWRARNLRRSIRISDSSSIALQLLLRASKKLETVQIQHKDAAGLVIARDIEHAIGIKNLLKENGDSVEIVHSQDKEANTRLQKFQESDANWLVSVDMCSEGFNAPRLRVIAYLTTVVTKSRFIQGITRAVRMSTSRASVEPIPRNPSHVFAPADPLLMEYARSWAKTKPYLIKKNEPTCSIQKSSWISRGPTMPMEAVRDGAGKIIRMHPTELPNFLKG